MDISVQQGLIFSLMALGVAISFRLLDFPDLTVDGSFVLGAAVASKLITANQNYIMATLLSLIAGFAAGICTGILHTKFRINKLLSGILMSVILYSVNLRIMGPNIPVMNHPNLFSTIENTPFLSAMGSTLILTTLITLFLIIITFLLLTEWGTALRATGDNEQIVKAIGMNTDNIKIIGLGLANTLPAFSGAIAAQHQGFADVTMGIGIIILGVASIIIGETILSRIGFLSRMRYSSVWLLSIACIIGSLIYQIVVFLGLRIGLAPTDMKIATGLMVIAILALSARGKGGARLANA